MATRAVLVVLDTFTSPTGGGKAGACAETRVTCADTHTRAQIQAKVGKSDQNQSMVPMSIFWL